MITFRFELPGGFESDVITDMSKFEWFSGWPIFLIILLDIIRILNVSLVGTSGGPYFPAVSLVHHHIYTSCKPHGRARGLIAFPSL
jgi:hypothetical protein